jgi:hypothetical protein
VTWHSRHSTSAGGHGQHLTVVYQVVTPNSTTDYWEVFTSKTNVPCSDLATPDMVTYPGSVLVEVTWAPPTLLVSGV